MYFGFVYLQFLSLGGVSFPRKEQKVLLMNSMQTCNSVTFYFMKKTHFLILAGSGFYQI